ncbi:gamma-glutamyl-gamma-aminobutyrate hydrolase family protein [Lysinibacillus agricola]|uniref:Gamma-glutamyl-gamma-aminobutyrate hydrolase family protein n=1 Tax=Lysinibacillus agricola TaxID=2590012 RepID=A0ABX7AUX5_9BACI|nr:MULTISPECIES: gamma-glutamyl-gamma-aminobutyrate hydrolase family protein [Lysinibacillus]KOS62793.1 glutamine amidotransferase [Lysinibacillus sp. FJAT-14222]QQP13767.1 gamma-glutamyl-gamma-aminobutyrate hydrolase family protein [Lysinibacillus agricola]
MKPVIGITAFVEDDLSSRLNEAYSKSVIEAGGIPLIIPLGVEEDVVQILSLTDGLLLSGGYDVHPFLFGAEPTPKLGKVHPERDSVELALIEAAYIRKMPIFGICRGIQMLNVALGGTLYQDMESEYHSSKLIKHLQQAARGVATHYVSLTPDTLLRTIIEEEKIAVNSFHHQAVNVVAEKLKVAAKSSDGIVEAVVHEDLPFCLAVQWHPEEQAMAGDEVSKKLFTAFVKASLMFKVEA